MNRLGWMSSIIVVLMLFLAGCFLSVEQRWEKIDEQMQQEIGVKTKDYYVSEWGNPAKRVKLADGGSIWTCRARQRATRTAVLSGAAVSSSPMM